MSIDSAPVAVSTTAATAASATRTSRRKGEADPPRPVAGKRALLHARRLLQRELQSTVASPNDCESALRLRADDGSVSFVLSACELGLVVERTQRRPLGACFVQALLFTAHDSFDRWCEADATRFDEPMLHHRLRREGHARLGGKR